ncbi:YheT family hydrolase [Paludisphaera mucosa]|uniref:Alpha/beta fold hydrolase n=1 Tax=Paludisphaera mucosa TaxID=3030827 RepID=A0ABT6FCP6_9BACT|nr:alpha/beta fold hydrolase [Paludisphaera mucosa]MDG3005363.1 alpha/beta fold hydrolase [Paludisphaera mucosa]
MRRSTSRHSYTRFMPNPTHLSEAPISAAADALTPRFDPHPWFPGGHAQTIGGRYVGPGRIVLDSTERTIDLPDGDRICVLESTPQGWAPGAPAAVLLHGLASTAEAPYILRMARRLDDLGVRVVRMNLRGAGRGFGLARGFYHAGRTEDVRAVVDRLAERASRSPIAVVGFSLGANLALKLAAEASRPSYDGAPIDGFVAANPPIDLSACCRAMQHRQNRLYDWSFVRWLRTEVRRLHARFPELGPPELDDVRSVYDFDDRYTAPRNGFADAEDYYRRNSAGPLAPEIRMPGLVVHAADDPFIPVSAFEGVAFPPYVRFELLPHGGHLGYIARRPWRGDRRWLETRLAAWLAERWGLNVA